MARKKEKWNPPSWPWELELITLLFFLVALLAPMYLGGDTAQEATALKPAASAHQDLLTTQFGFLWALITVALYVMHLAISFVEINRVTVSPLHLLSPCVFAVLAYYRIDSIADLENTAFSSIDGSISQVLILFVIVALVTSILARLRKFRYLLDFTDVQWDITSRAVYDSTYFSLIFMIRPLLYAPKQYRACNDGILVEGWFYAAPYSFNDIRAMAVLNSTSTSTNGLYYASSARNLVRIELHDSLKPMFISPADREELVRYCVPFIARKKARNKADPTRHDMLHAADTSADGTRAGATKAGATKAGSNIGPTRPATKLSRAGDTPNAEKAQPTKAGDKAKSSATKHT